MKRAAMAFLHVWLLASCGREHAIVAVTKTVAQHAAPPVGAGLDQVLPETAPFPRPAPRVAPEFCWELWYGMVDREGIITPFDRAWGDSISLIAAPPGDPEPITLAEARESFLAMRDARFPATLFDGPIGEGQLRASFHRLRASPDALAEFDRVSRRGVDAARIYAACAFAELDRDRYDTLLAELKTSEEEGMDYTPCMGFNVAVPELVANDAIVPLHTTPSGFVMSFGGEAPGWVEEARVRAAVYASTIRGRLPNDLIPFEDDALSIDARGGSLRAVLRLDPRTLVSFRIDDTTGEATHIRYVRRM